MKPQWNAVRIAELCKELRRTRIKLMEMNAKIPLSFGKARQELATADIALDNAEKELDEVFTEALRRERRKKKKRVAKR